MVQCKNDEIRVTANFRGLWHIPFIAKKTQSYCLPAGSSVEYFMNLLLQEFGSEFKTILPFCNPVIAGRLRLRPLMMPLV